MGLAEHTHTHTKPGLSRCHVYMLTPTWTREGTRPRRQEEVKRACRETAPLGGRVEHGAMAGVEHRPRLPGIYRSSQAPAKPSLVRPIRVEGRRSSIHLHPYPILLTPFSAGRRRGRGRSVLHPMPPALTASHHSHTPFCLDFMDLRVKCSNG
jgi:hypothetical protein